MHTLQAGQKARIVRIEAGDRAYRKKLLAFGLLPGTEFTLKRKAPLGDPVEVEVRGCTLGLRKYEAKLLVIEKVE